MHYEIKMIFETALEELVECATILVLFHIYSGGILHTRHLFPRRKVVIALPPVHFCQLEPVASDWTFSDLTGIDIAQWIKAVMVSNWNHSDIMSTTDGQKCKTHNALKTKKILLNFHYSHLTGNRYTSDRCMIHENE